MDERSGLLSALAAELPWYIASGVRFTLAVADRIGLPVTDLQCIGALSESGPLTSGQLAELMGLTTGAITRVVDRLERDGYVRREPDPSDRRRVILHLEPGRADELTGYYRRLGERWHDQIGRYDDAQLRFLLGFVRYGRQVAADETEQLRAVTPHAKRRRPAT
jgi:DNA-binding MarR family transcriptional regulator